MTSVPECVLARELGVPYASMALSTDYDCWKDDGEMVSVAVVDRTLRENADKAKRLFIAAIAAIARQSDVFAREFDEAQNVAKSSIM